MVRSRRTATTRPTPSSCQSATANEHASSRPRAGTLDVPLSLHVPLPIAVEVHRLLAPQRQLGDPARLLAIGHAPAVLAPCRLLGKAQQVGIGDVVMVAGPYRAAGV